MDGFPEMKTLTLNDQTFEVVDEKARTEKLDASALPDAINQALADAKESGELGNTDVYILADGETLEDAPETAEIIIDPNEEAPVYVQTVNGLEPDANGNVNIESNEVYILADGETVNDAPKTAEIIINPNEETPDYIQTVNGVAPDTNGNVDVQGKFSEEDKAEIVSGVLDALPVYDGEYEVTPSTEEELTLLTAGRYVGADVKIAKIPYYEVSNNSGGTTANIGG